MANETLKALAQELFEAKTESTDLARKSQEAKTRSEDAYSRVLRLEQQFWKYVGNNIPVVNILVNENKTLIRVTAPSIPSGSPTVTVEVVN